MSSIMLVVNKSLPQVTPDSFSISYATRKFSLGNMFHGGEKIK